jgi:alanyl-tRNA synthetase
VLRKILRRASRFGFSYLDQQKPFLHKIVPSVAEIMSDYSEVSENKDHVVRIIKNEEERFLQTLKTGSEMLNQYIEKAAKQSEKVLPGQEAFLLHDTYGFPLDLTREICREQGLKVDEKGFDAELEKQRERGRANVVSAFVNFKSINPGDYPQTVFTGYEKMQDRAKVLDTVDEKDQTIIVTDKTPFYAEAGGQIGDRGIISGNGAEFVVKTTEKSEGVFLHIGRWKGEERFAKGDEVDLKVDYISRKATMRNHTSTHLLHKALQEVLGDHVKQAGSYVSPQRLRFDFTHFESISPEDLDKIEARVNQQILAAHRVNKKEMSYDEAVKSGAMALFGEKYGDKVRVVSVGDYSCELCGGTHLDNSAEIGLFAIISEASVAAGVRRIEAVSGSYSLEVIHQLKENERALTAVLDTDAAGLVQKARKLVDENKQLRRELDQLRKAQAHGKIDDIKNKVTNISGVDVIVSRIDNMNVNELKEICDEIIAQKKENTLVLLARSDDKVNFVTKLSKDLVKRGLHAGKLIKEVAKVAGGGGGGRPDMATAGGKDVTKVDEALKKAQELIAEQIKQ